MMERKIIVDNDNDNDNVLQVKKLDEIVYMESFGCKTKTYCCEGKEYLIKKCLSRVEEKLLNERFFKIHKSFIINIDYLKGINVNANKTVLLHNGIELKIAHRKYKDFMEFVKGKFDFW
ncbi:MAG: LytTR family transcriptional regulator [Bacteroidales bacterium]|nr:LytTR family transcriptional regulator [Bacteroidales bacterium]